MKLDRFRAPALAATAVLLISGAGIALARGPSATVPARAAPAGAEAVGRDADALQQGDQTAPDVTVVGSAHRAKAPTASTPKATVRTTVKAAAKTASEGSETPENSDGSEATGTESDGPGGHQDPAGQNVDHQFQGEE
jgi:hypothetical protein